jgi:hypothetical protein
MGQLFGPFYGPESPSGHRIVPVGYIPQYVASILSCRITFNVQWAANAPCRRKREGETKNVKFISGLVLGAVLAAGMSLYAQNERAMHPRLAAAIDALRDARQYLVAAPHDFGGHKAAAVASCDNAIKQLNLALAYREKRDR